MEKKERVETQTRMTVGELDERAQERTLGGAELVNEEVVRNVPERKEEDGER